MSSRRNFLKTAGAAAVGLYAAPSLAVEPFKRTGGPRLQLSLAAYSLREFFGADVQKPNNKLPDAAKQIDMFKFIDYCAEHGSAGAELTSYYLAKEATPEYLLALKRHAFLKGVAISGTAVGNNFAQAKGPALDKEIAGVKTWIDRAAIMGAPHIRVFAGASKGISDAEARKLCIESLEECSDYAGTKGVFLGLENHGGIVAEASGLLEIISAVKSKWLGINLDSGNFHSEDPYAELAQCAPYAVNVQIKVEISRKGQKAEASDYVKLVKILRDANYQGWVALEYEAKEDPYTAVPVALQKLKELMK
jgi:sugar phosphate isomerase/epimerase